jgi:hypothetical protein
VRTVQQSNAEIDAFNVEKICHANESTLLPTGGKCRQREEPSALADRLGGTRAHYEAQAHEIISAISAAVGSAQAGLNWPRAPHSGGANVSVRTREQSTRIINLLGA